VYNIGGNSETANIDIVRTLCGLIDAQMAADPDLSTAFPKSPAAAGKRSEELITYVRDRPGHDRRYAIDYRKAERELGYAPTRNLAQGLRETLTWYLDNTGWWQALLGGEYTAWIDKNYKRA
jgi:dTDP-glucose 4,6-dehydratase